MADIPKLVYIGVLCIALVVTLSAILPSVFGIWFNSMDTTGMTWDEEPDNMVQLPIKLMPFFGLVIIGAVVVVIFKSAL